MAAQQFQFDPDQPHQREAIHAVVDVFRGLPRAEHSGTFLAREDEIVPNAPDADELSRDFLEANLRVVRERHNLTHPDAPIDDVKVEYDDGPMLDGVSADSHRCPHFTVEMETGTGKTYVYFRTILELFRDFGLRKFIIVVPSVAILEGVKKAFEVTQSHFRGLYGATGLGLREYDGQQLGFVRSFATSQNPVVMVTTLQSIASLKNLFFQESEKLPGDRRAFQWVQATRPVVILDEPQNMGSARSQQAIRTLRPLFVLRYSATHRAGETPNLVHRLTPVQAFRQGLVKQIEVVGVQELGFGANLAIRLIEVTRNPIAARVRVPVREKGRTTEEELTLRQGTNLRQKTHLDEHDGFVVANIDVGTGGKPSRVVFENGVALTTDDALQGSRADVWRAQIEKTLEAHFERQRSLRPLGVKVLSLFFVDRVANYSAPDGLIRRLFDECYAQMQDRFPEWKPWAAAEVRRSYFASKRDKKSGVVTELDIENDNSAEAKDAFRLIMKDKERLLSFPDGKDDGKSVAFLFAHSALKEGWDNPNVFQICTLNETVSPLKKRQEIGRGLRLCVNQELSRPAENGLNVLTVVANDSYESFVRRLQDEYVEEGLSAPPDPGRGMRRTPARRRDAAYQDAAFRNFWRKLCQGLRCRIELDTETLVDACVKHLVERTRFPEPTLAFTRGRFVLVDYKVEVLKGGGAGSARLRLTERRSTGESAGLGLFDPTTSERWVKVSDKLSKFTGNPHWKGFDVERVWEHWGETRVRFRNEVEISTSESHSFQLTEVADQRQEESKVATEPKPVPDVIGRAAEATRLTRSTLVTIFRRLGEAQTRTLFVAPEAWTNTFIDAVGTVLADMVVEGLRYEPLGRTREGFDPELPDAFFPELVEQPQKELVDGGPRSLYDLVQVDSDNERTFIERSLRPGDGLRVYFKFPPKFLLTFPKVIGNYNPDWGVVRLEADGSATLELVRETKGSTDLASLRFATESRKVRAAQRYFEALGIDYRVVAGSTSGVLQTGRELSERRAKDLRLRAPKAVAKGKRRIPVYDLRAAAGAFSSDQSPAVLGQLAIDVGARSDAGLFIAQVVGDSMDQVVQSGTWCLWEHTRAAGVSPARRGEYVLVRLDGRDDPDLGGYTFKKWSAAKGVVLEPRSRNPLHQPITLTSQQEPEILARFIRRLDESEIGDDD